MRGNRIDANQKDIVDALRRVGALWVSTSGDPQVGFDGICCFRSRVFLVEIKDGKKPASRRRLTEGEAARMDDLKRQGVRLHVWSSVDEAFRALGIIESKPQASSKRMFRHPFGIASLPCFHSSRAELEECQRQYDDIGDAPNDLQDEDWGRSWGDL